MGEASIEVGAHAARRHSIHEKLACSACPSPPAAEDVLDVDRMPWRNAVTAPHAGFDL